MQDAKTKTFTAVERANLTPRSAREFFRSQGFSGPTSGFADGCLQCNLVLLPEPYASDFEAFCIANPKTCPLVSFGPAPFGVFPELGDDLDLRTDLPFYNVIRDGVVVDQVKDLVSLWQDDLHAFAIGCSFTFERALTAASILQRHITEQKTVPMYQTNLSTIGAGLFGGPVVVSMRPIEMSRVDQVISICENFPHAHGAPLHVGDPSVIGINDIQRPDWGDAVAIKDGEVPVFWGCGVTSQMAVFNAKPTIAFSHAPGAMLITDWPENFPANHTNQPTRSSR